MEVKVLLFIAILTQVSCDKHSLTFVIDDTYSLIDDIKQVINATKLIVGFENASNIEDYVLVTFNNPETVLKKKTQNPKELIEALDSVKVHDGNKTVCPEVALSGLKLALNESREGSRFYVFTDSSARDYENFEEVKALCQAKKSQIYFILSGHCGDISMQRYQVFQKLAAACKGQAITIDKDDVAKVPEYLKNIIEGDRNVIESVLIPANKWINTSIKFSVDVLTEKTIISASGIDVDLNITTAKNGPITRHNKTWTRNFKVFEPTRLRGIYIVHVRGKSPVEVTIMARTNFTFEYGFSMESVTAVKETDPQPFTDIKTRLTIFAKDPEGSAEVKGVELHGGTKKLSLPLTRVADNVYATEEFFSPEQPFQIAVVALAKKAKKTVKSFAKTLVTPIHPDSVEQIKVKKGASIDVHCRTPSNKTNAQITWYKKTPKEGNFSVIKGQTKEVYHVDKPADKVYYKCLARNATGTDQYNGQIDIQVRPEFIYPPPVILTNISDPATIECKIIMGNPRPKITWEFKRVNATKYEQLSNQNDTYNLASAQLEDSGVYRCFANSTAGSTEKFTELKVQVAPEVLKTNAEFTVKEGTSIDVECSILNGVPKPEITWYSKQLDELDATEFEEIVEEKNETLHVARAKISKIYKCEASNSAGMDFNTVKIYVEARPEFKFTTRYVTVNEGEPATIDCKLRKGSPPLERSWEKKLKGMTSFSTLKHEAETLDITAAKLSHAGDYKCVAENSEGRDEKITELIVQAVPSIEDVASNETALEHSNVTLKCRTKGFPKPTVNWFYKGPELPEFVNMSKTGEALHLENVQVSFSGQYKCVAENEIGRAEKIDQLVVNAPPKIIFVPPNTAKHTAVEGDPAIRLPCAAVGHPTPVITWLVDNKIVGLDKCQLPKETGPCRAGLTKWYYDKALKECRIFTYGGCHGNDNRFDSKDECSSECSSKAEPVVPTPGKCQLPMKVGPCRAALPMWYYDNTLKQCLPFAYGGCNGNENRFTSKMKCLGECIPPPPIGKCQQPVDVGPCRAALPMWYYNNTFKQCLPFSYGGCKGNENRFKSKAACEGVCVLETQPKGKCRQPKDVGPCRAALPMWYYDNTFKQCLPFSYGGCRGNENRFNSKAACEGECTLETQPKGTFAQIYIEDNALIIPNPKEANSSRYHNYVCRATNEVGQDSQTYEVVITDHIEFSKVNEIYAPYKKTYYIKCSLPYLDPSLIKWYKNSKLSPGRTGPLLHIGDPTDLDSGNYTCRVTGSTDSASHTVQVIFGQRPFRNQTLYNVEWNGDEKSLNCYTSAYPEGKYEWFYNGKNTGWNNDTIKIADWGEYICNVKNPLGNLEIIFKVTTPDKGCRVPKSLFTSELAPLVLDSSLSWPLLRTAQEHFIVPRSEKLKLICQDDGHSLTNNSFTKFPNVKSVYAACEKEDSFTVDGNIRKISDFECKQKVMPGVIQTKIPCLGNDTELVQVGFFVDGFTEVYQSCMDLTKMVPLYTKMNTIPVKREYVSDASTEDTCVQDSECCYESVQLVNGTDVSFGPAKSATSIYALNSVNYCKLKDDFDWYNIDMILRSEIQYTVWTGAAQYMEVDINGDKIVVPRYLWKVLIYYSGSDKETVAIIHENVASPGPQLCAGACGNKTTFFEPLGGRTYCCSLEDFKEALGVDLDLSI